MLHRGRGAHKEYLQTGRSQEHLYRLKEKSLYNRTLEEQQVGQLKGQHEIGNDSQERLPACLPSILLKGLVWQQGSKLFARWRERSLMLTKGFFFLLLLFKFFCFS